VSAVADDVPGCRNIPRHDSASAVLPSNASPQMFGRLCAAERTKSRRIVIAMTGATGAGLGIGLLEAVGQLGVETDVILSEWAQATIKI
jgi:hypothetical protein